MIRRQILLILGALLLTGSAFADSAAAKLQVSVQVVSRAILTVDSQPATVDITAADIERGYLDVESSLQWRGRTNSRQGYLLQVAKSDASFGAVDLAFAGTSMHVANESWVARPYVPGGETLTVHARLVLGSAMQPGRYALPISVSATPL